MVPVMLSITTAVIPIAAAAATELLAADPYAIEHALQYDAATVMFQAAAKDLAAAVDFSAGGNRVEIEV